MNEKLVRYAVNDVVFLYDCVMHGEIENDLFDFKSLCQLLYIYTKLRKDNMKIGMIHYTAD